MEKGYGKAATSWRNVVNRNDETTSKRLKPRLMAAPNYPDAIDPGKVGQYGVRAQTGGGYTWDMVLENRVWMHPERGVPDEFDGNDYYIAFATYAEARSYYEEHEGCEEPLALVLQREHVTTERITEWPPQFLVRPRRTGRTIPDLLILVDYRMQQRKISPYRKTPTQSIQEKT